MLASLRGRDRIVERLVEPMIAVGLNRADNSPPGQPPLPEAQSVLLSVLQRKVALTLLLLFSSVIAAWLGVFKGALCFVSGGVVFALKERRALRQRARSVDRDLPALLTSVASSVRAGIDPLVALSEAREFLPVDSVLTVELERFHRSLEAGGDEDEVIDRLFREITTPDIELFKGCLRLSRKHGSSLAEPLHRVTRVVRQRQSFRRKTRAALAMHRMSAVGISLCAALIAFMQVFTNPDGIQLVLQHSIGSKLLVSGGLLIVIGVGWMMSLGRETSV
jgi:Flp pilus assembly protein TadB